MSQTIKVDVPLNRVEGDLEIRVEMDDGVVTDAWSSGTMYRGIEKILVGRASLDGLVITPRICGICTTGHLTAASRVLDAISGAALPPDAVRIRNVALMTEHIQSDVRHTFLMFAVDFTNPAYQDLPLYADAMRRYEPFKGEEIVEVVRETRKVLEVVAIVGGQWPHSSFMVPGGIASSPSASDIRQCKLLIRQYRAWYERRVLGCPIERWLQVQNADQLDAWLDESLAHQSNSLGFLIRFARAAGLDRIGQSHNTFLSYGALDMPADTRVQGHQGQGRLVPSGFLQGTALQEFDQAQVAEHVAHSWYEDYEGGRHPFEGETHPYASGKEGRKYSWAKAPRYDRLPAETGPLAEMLAARSPLFLDLVGRGGASALVRQLARLTRPATLIPAMEQWLDEVAPGGPFYASPGEIEDGQGFGLTHASRGALGHWVRIEDGVIQHYQIITPTAWNAAPRDSSGTRGPIEEALVGTRVRDIDNPIELGHVVRSFDPCLVCTVHAVLGRVRREPGRGRGQGRERAVVGGAP